MSETPDPGVAGAPEAPPAAFPWPPAEDVPVTAALADTWRGAVLQPRRFFAAMPPGNTGAAVLYYLVIGIVVAALQLFWQTLLPGGAGLLPELDAAARLAPLTGFLLSPLYLLASLLLAAGATHLLVLVMVPQQRGFDASVRVLAFAYSPMLLSIVPRVGALVGFAWMVGVAVIGLREAHDTSTGRAATAVLVPLILVIALAAVAALLLAAGALLLTP